MLVSAGGDTIACSIRRMGLTSCRGNGRTREMRAAFGDYIFWICVLKWSHKKTKGGQREPHGNQKKVKTTNMEPKGAQTSGMCLCGCSTGTLQALETKVKICMIKSFKTDEKAYPK